MAFRVLMGLALVVSGLLLALGGVSVFVLGSRDPQWDSVPHYVLGVLMLALAVAEFWLARLHVLNRLPYTAAAIRMGVV